MTKTSLVLMVAACGGAETSLVTSPSTGRDPKLVAIDHMREALEARDAHAVAALYADDATLDPAGGKPAAGRAMIEKGLAEMLAPAQSMQVAFPRIWLKGDVAIVEAVFRATHPASSGIHDVGEDAVFVLEFDRAGKIAHERDYQENATLAAQASGEDGAPAVPVLPTTREVHIAGDSPNDASLIAWANDVEARQSTSDADALAVMDEHLAWDCALGFHATSRDELAKPLAKWRAAFPDMKWTATRVWPVEDYVVVEELFEGTQDGEFGGMPATHKRATWHWLEIWQHRDGKIMHGWSWANFEELEQQLHGPVEHKVKPACALES